jgi:hypothetical protein
MSMSTMNQQTRDIKTAPGVTPMTSRKPLSDQSNPFILESDESYFKEKLQRRNLLCGKMTLYLRIRFALRKFLCETA